MSKTPIRMLKGVMFGFLTRTKPKTIDDARIKLAVAFQEKVTEGEIGQIHSIADAWWAKREAKREARKVARMRSPVFPQSKSRRKRGRSRKQAAERSATTTDSAADNLSAVRVLLELTGDSKVLEQILAAVQQVGGPANAISIIRILGG